MTAWTEKKGIFSITIDIFGLYSKNCSIYFIRFLLNAYCINLMFMTCKIGNEMIVNNFLYILMILKVE